MDSSELLFPGFAWLGPQTHFSKLHQALWRDPQQPLSAEEPPHLAKFISEFPPDSAPAAAAPIRYIDLEKHPLLAATHNVRTVQRDWHEKAVFLVRDEYRELLKAALESPPANLLVTGHSRIGKSFACAFLILVLLAAGQPFFYIEHTSIIYHFSTHGVQCGNPTNVWDLDEGEAADQLLRTSWLLIDVGPHGWEIPPAFLFTKFALCTSPKDGMRYYVKKFKALYWHMRPWSRTEALSVARHYEISDTKESLRRITPSLATFSPSVASLERPSTFSESWLQLPTPTSSNQ